jgi:hypothetical protein
MKYAIEDTTLIGIADAIRAKTESTDPIAVKDFAKAIEGLGGDAADVDLLELKKTITEYRDDKIVNLPDCAFCGCTNLKMVVLPKVENIAWKELFAGCTNLVVADFTALTTVGEGGYDEHAGPGAFIFPNPFQDTKNLKALVNRGGLFQMGTNYYDYYSEFELPSSFGGYFDYNEISVYIPREYIVEEVLLGIEDIDEWGDIITGEYTYGYDWAQLYKLGRIRAIEDYTVDGTVTGALDFAKMGIDMG